MFMLVNDGTKDLGPGGVIPEVFFNSIPELKCDGRENRLSTPIKIVAVKVADMEKISGYVPNPCFCRGLYKIEDFLIFGCSPVI